MLPTAAAAVGTGAAMHIVVLPAVDRPGKELRRHADTKPYGLLASLYQHQLYKHKTN
jgi:hypothetical protein